MREALQWLSISFGAIAAVLWLFASIQKVPFREERDETGTFPVAIIDTDSKGKQVDVLKTAERQTFWNGLAAGAASVSAACQALSQWLQGS